MSIRKIFTPMRSELTSDTRPIRDGLSIHCYAACGI